MKGGHFFIIFFLILVTAVLLIPAPMFPGDNLLAMAKLATSEYTFILGALINALLYSLIAWAVFVLAMRRMKSTSDLKPSVKKSKKKE